MDSSFHTEHSSGQVAGDKRVTTDEILAQVPDHCFFDVIGFRPIVGQRLGSLGPGLLYDWMFS